MSKLSPTDCAPAAVLITSWIARADRVDAMRPSFQHLVDGRAPAMPASRRLSAVPRVAIEGEAHVDQTAGHRHAPPCRCRAPTGTPCPRRGSFTPAPSWLLAKARAKSDRGPSPRRSIHLRAQDDVDVGEAGEGEHRLLDRDVGAIARPSSSKSASRRRPSPRADLRHRHAGRLGDERHGARGARIDLQDIDLAALMAYCTFIRPTTPSALRHRLGLALSAVTMAGEANRAAGRRRYRRSGCRPPRYAP